MPSRLNVGTCTSEEQALKAFVDANKACNITADCQCSLPAAGSRSTTVAPVESTSTKASIRRSSIRCPERSRRAKAAAADVRAPHVSPACIPASANARALVADDHVMSARGGSRLNSCGSIGESSLDPRHHERRAGRFERGRSSQAMQQSHPVTPASQRPRPEGCSANCLRESAITPMRRAPRARSFRRRAPRTATAPKDRPAIIRLVRLLRVRAISSPGGAVRATCLGGLLMLIGASALVCERARASLLCRKVAVQPHLFR